INRFGKTIYEIFFGPYTQKVWGVHPSELSASFGKYRIPTKDIKTTIIKSFRKGKKKLTGKEPYYAPLVLTIYYPKKGAATVPNKLYQMILNKNGKVHLNSNVIKVNIKDNTVESVIYSQNDKVAIPNKARNLNQIKLTADYFISTIPITNLIKMLSFSDDNLERLCRKLRFRSVVIVCILVNKRMNFTAQSLYFYDRIFTRVSSMKNFGGIETSPENKTGLLCEIPCDFGDHIWNTVENDICEDVTDKLINLGFFNRNNVEDKFIVKVKYAYPVYILGYEKIISEIIQYLTKIENLLTGGRFGMYKYIDMDVSTLSGFKMAEHIIAGKNKSELISIPLEERLYA
ncbi:MAG: hypothetical protein QME68_08845, partial [Elusimicrobiota bacterium]|nr:hypothetical protein [Elusimicrobiota bacterium]